MTDKVVIHDSVRARWQSIKASYAFPPAVLAVEAQIERLLSQSRFCEQVIRQQPECLHAIISQESLQSTTYRALLKQDLPGGDDEAQLRQVLARFRNRQMLAICWHDLILQCDVQSVLLALSELADVCVQLACHCLQQSLSQQHGVPRVVTTPADSVAEAKQAEFIVVALGKLGGRELNFSSDIDVMFCFDHNGYCDGVKALSNKEFFTKLGQALVRVLNDRTQLVYRVDCRLRPFGDSGPLVVSFDHLQEYYQIHGREWERYALVKARSLNGNEAAQEALNTILKPFVYRQYIDFTVLQTLRDMKQKIAQQVSRKQQIDHLKLGPGGIREIEFIAQLLQLTHAGLTMSLQTQSLYKALEEIEQMAYLSPLEVTQLLQSYEFLRRAENRLQMWDDRQVHELPRDAEQLTVLAQSMGYDDASAFRSALQGYQQQVSVIFDNLAAVPSKDQQATDVAKDFWQELVEAEDQSKLEDKAGLPQLFFEQDEILQRLKALLSSPIYRTQDEVGRARLHGFMPILLQELSKHDDAAIVLSRLLPILLAILRRSAYLLLLTENVGILRQLIAVVGSSPWIAKHVSSNPILLDDLITADSDEHHRAELQQQFKLSILAQKGLDDEQVLERVRLFKHAAELRIACADVQGVLPLMQVSDRLSWLAEVVVQGCLQYLEHREQPSLPDQPALPNLAVIAFGKLGGSELSYGSDLDLVYLTDGQSQTDPAMIKLTRKAQGLSRMLSLRTVSGQMYEVDLRLRPDGNAGPLVATLPAMHEYYRSRAWLWELQALVRARCVAGEESIVQAFEELRRDVLCQPREQQVLAQEVLAMRQKLILNKGNAGPLRFNLKHDLGGITDIEFMVQYAILENAHREPALCRYSDNVRQLAMLAEADFIAPEMAQDLSEIYCQYRNTSHRMALQEQQISAVDDADFVAQRALVQGYWKKCFAAYLD